MKYGVEQKYFDDGSITAKIVPMSDEAGNVVIEEKGYDLYIDVFDSQDDAVEFRVVG